MCNLKETVGKTLVTEICEFGFNENLARHVQTFSDSISGCCWLHLFAQGTCDQFVGSFDCPV